jgi:hypothetical protein
MNESSISAAFSSETQPELSLVTDNVGSSRRRVRSVALVVLW